MEQGKGNPLDWHSILPFPPLKGEQGMVEADEAGGKAAKGLGLCSGVKSSSVGNLGGKEIPYSIQKKVAAR